MVFFYASGQIKDVARPIVPPRQVDLGVEEIYAYGCACDLPGIDALYFNKVQVEVSAKFKFTADDLALIGTLKVSYFDLMRGEPNPMKSCCRPTCFGGGLLIWWMSWEGRFW